MIHYTITGRPKFAGPDGDVIEVQTAEAGSVHVLRDRRSDAEAWARAMALDPAPFVPEPVPVPSYRDLRAAAYRDELGKDKGDVLKTLGDVIDVLIAEVAAIRGGRSETTGFADLLPKIAAIKARFPAA